jgi:hypothetical protein
VNNGAFLAVMLAGGFVLYLAANNRLAVYLGMLMGGGAAPATGSPGGGGGSPATTTPPVPAPVVGGSAGLG